MLPYAYYEAISIEDTEKYRQKYSNGEWGNYDVKEIKSPKWKQNELEFFAEDAGIEVP